MRRYVSFGGNVAQHATFPPKKDGIFRPAGGEMLLRVSDRVTPINDTRYAVVHQTGRFTR
jgi:hypothetical protein